MKMKIIIGTWIACICGVFNLVMVSCSAREEPSAVFSPSTIPAKEPQEKLDTGIDSPTHPDNDSDVAQARSKTDEEKRDHRDMRRLGKAQELKVCACMRR